MSIVINNYKEFSRLLVASKELDPMYDFMYNTRVHLGPEWTQRFALHLFMFYDADGAARCAKQSDHNTFWDFVVCDYPVAKRGTERRHFRGANGMNAVEALSKHGTPDRIWNKLSSSSYSELVWTVTNQFQGCQIGPYFMWKLMDILDRCLGTPVDILPNDILNHLPEAPRDAAKTLWPNDNLMVVMDRVRHCVEDLTAPGEPNVDCGYPEAETILCALKGYLKGTYHIGSDIIRRHNELKGHPDLLKYLPPKLDWKQYVRPKDLDTTQLSA